MPQLDFKEIPPSNLASGEQDTFELFAREFLEMVGYEIISGPDRGSDGGRDIIVQETRIGIGGTTQVRWLVSCKHKAHSGSSVVLSDEPNILERTRSHGCIGFIGFYSTIPASSFTKLLEGIKTNTPGFEHQILDNEKIERILLSTGPGLGLTQRFFPASYSRWDKMHHDIDLAMLRVGMPQPVAYKIPGDDKVYTLQEVMERYSQGNQFIFNPWLPQNLILCNNILGITKIVGSDGLIDIPADYLERMTESMYRNIEHMRQQMLKTKEAEITDDRKRRTKAKKPRRK
jgi:hypothetical protein